MIKKVISFLFTIIILAGIANAKSDKNVVVDIMELSLDENIATPQVDTKLHDVIASHMNKLAIKLKNKKHNIETTRNGEVIIATIEADKLFKPNGCELKENIGTILDDFVELTQVPDKYKILLVMHNDNTGNEEYTYRLSESRVNAIYKWMEDLRINTKSVVPYAMGDTQPLLPNNSRLNRKKNRRLEIYIIPDNQIIQLAKSKRLY